MKKLIALFVILTMVLSLYACAESRHNETIPADEPDTILDPTGEPTTESAPTEETKEPDSEPTEPPTEEPTEEPSTEPGEDPADEYVDDARREEVPDTVSDGGEMTLYCYPRVLLDSADAESWNKAIADELEPVVNGAVAGLGRAYGRVDYDAWLWENTLTVVIQLNVFDMALSEYRVAVFDLTTGELLDNDQVAALAGIDGGHQEIVQATMLTAFEEMNSGVTQTDFYEEQRENTISQENLDAARLFLAEDGGLMVQCKIHTIAGAGYDWYLLPVALP